MEPPTLIQDDDRAKVWWRQNAAIDSIGGSIRIRSPILQSTPETAAHAYVLSTMYGSGLPGVMSPSTDGVRISFTVTEPDFSPICTVLTETIDFLRFEQARNKCILPNDEPTTWIRWLLSDSFPAALISHELQSITYEGFQSFTCQLTFHPFLEVVVCSKCDQKGVLATVQKVTDILSTSTSQRPPRTRCRRACLPPPTMCISDSERATTMLSHFFTLGASTLLRSLLSA
jgi:hypothetical protein